MKEYLLADLSVTAAASYTRIVQPSRRKDRVMLAIGLLLGGGVAFVLMLWLIRELAVYAMPFWAGLAVFLGLYHHQPGLFTPLFGGILAAGLVFAVWWIVFGFTSSSAVRGIVALSYAVPPTVIAYLGGVAIARWAIGATVADQIIGIAGAAYIAVHSWQRIAGRESPSPLPQHHPA
jgi:hypothetical protein